ncbi:MAG: D-alanyl-D-alanine carboxypeptidase/D-alanyl-D-alanine-endopeptidase [Pseudomonadota bacterium]
MLRRLAFSVLVAWLPLAHAALPQPVSQLMADARMPEDAIGVLVLRGDTTLISHLAERPLQPASTMKLVTTLVGLEQLGPIFRGRTDILTNGELAGDVLKGDLILRGGADVDFSGEVLATMLQALRNQGVRRIEGRLVLDRQLFNPARIDAGITPFDEYPDSYYNVIPDALLVNKNMLLLDMRSDGQRVKLAMQPQLDRVTVESNLTLIDADCAKWEDGWKYPEIVRARGGAIKVVLQGTFPKNCVKSNSINVLDRHDYLDRLFRAHWSKLGGTLSGETVDGITPPGARLLAEHVSRALPEVIRDINKPSDNALARTLFLSLGSLEPDVMLGSRPLPMLAGQTTFMRADQAVRNWMQRQGIDATGLVMDNGSGLSRSEKISPYQMALMLQAGLRSNWAPEFLASLPIVAVDGTMRRRLKDSPAAQRARLKTGTLKNVTAVAGYVFDAKGQQCVVVAMINSDLVSEGKGRGVLDALVDWVARSGM